MFISAANISTGLIKSTANYFNSSTFDSGIISGTGRFNDLFFTSTVITQSAANYYIVSAYFSPDIFKFIFGENATQNIDSLIIHKADLTGLTPQINNTAESLLVGIINKMLINETINFIKFSVTYWGYGYTDNSKIHTVLINFFKQLSLINEYEFPPVDNITYPNDY